jgi:hypothetical protein
MQLQGVSLRSDRLIRQGEEIRFGYVGSGRSGHFGKVFNCACCWCRLIPRSGASSNDGKTLFRLLEIVPMYYDTSLKTSRVDWSALFSPRRLSRNGKTFFFLPKNGFWREERRTERRTRKDTEDTTLVQIEEVERSIRALPFVTKLSPVGARNSHGHGYRVSLRCPSSEEYGSCGKKQEPPVQVSSRNPTLHACLQELLKRLQEKHGKCAHVPRVDAGR